MKTLKLFFDDDKFYQTYRFKDSIYCVKTFKDKVFIYFEPACNNHHKIKLIETECRLTGYSVEE